MVQARVVFAGHFGLQERLSLIDTGANISSLPADFAELIGVHPTGGVQSIVFGNNAAQSFPVAAVNVYFPTLDNRGGTFGVAIKPGDAQPIIGMDIMVPLGISIDTASQTLRIHDPAWEAFKEVAGGAVLVGGGIALAALGAAIVDGLTAPPPRPLRKKKASKKKAKSRGRKRSS